MFRPRLTSTEGLGFLSIVDAAAPGKTISWLNALARTAIQSDTDAFIRHSKGAGQERHRNAFARLLPRFSPSWRFMTRRKIVSIGYYIFLIFKIIFISHTTKQF